MPTSLNTNKSCSLCICHITGFPSHRTSTITLYWLGTGEHTAFCNYSPLCVAYCTEQTKLCATHSQSAPPPIHSKGNSCLAHTPKGQVWEHPSFTGLCDISAKHGESKVSKFPSCIVCSSYNIPLVGVRHKHFAAIMPSMIIKSVMLFPRAFQSEWLSQRTSDDLSNTSVVLLWFRQLSRCVWLYNNTEKGGTCVGSLKTCHGQNVDSDANSSRAFHSVKLYTTSSAYVVWITRSSGNKISISCIFAGPNCVPWLEHRTYGVHEI